MHGALIRKSIDLLDQKSNLSPSQRRDSDARDEQELSTVGPFVLGDGAPVLGHARDAGGDASGNEEPDVGAEELAGSVVAVDGDTQRDGDAHRRSPHADVDGLFDARHLDAKAGAIGFHNTVGDAVVQLADGPLEVGGALNLGQQH